MLESKWGSKMKRVAYRRTVVAVVAVGVSAAVFGAAPLAGAAVLGGADYTCTSADGTAVVPVTFNSNQIPTTAPAGLDVPAGFLPVEMTMTIPASMGEVLQQRGLTAIGGYSTNFVVGLGTNPIPMLSVSSMPESIAPGQATVLHFAATTGDFSTPAAGVASIALPESFAFALLDQSSNGAGTLECVAADVGALDLADMTLVKQGATVTARAAKKIKAGKRASVDVTVARRVSGVPAGVIEATIGSKTVGVGELAGGSVRLVLSKLKPGRYTAEVKYGGDEFTEPATGRVTFTVVK